MTSTSINTADAKEEFTDLVNRVIHNKERIILTRRGKEVAAIIPYEELELIQATIDKTDLLDAVEALKETRDEGAITLETLKDELG